MAFLSIPHFSEGESLIGIFLGNHCAVVSFRQQHIIFSQAFAQVEEFLILFGLQLNRIAIESRTS